MADQTQALTKVIVIGAAGNIGTPITKHLLAAKKFQVSALTREESTATFPSEVTPIRIPSYEFSHLLTALKGQDIVICALSGAVLGDQITIAKAAVEAGVKRFIPTELGLDTSGENTLKVAPCLAVKKDVVTYLKEHEDAISWTGVFCGLWFDFSFKDQPIWRYWNLERRTFTIFDDGNTPFEVSTLDQTAKAVVATILPENIAATKNQFVHVRSATYTPNQLLRYLKESTDDKWTVEHIDVQKLGQEGVKAFFEEVSSGSPPEAFGKHDKFQNAILDMCSAALMGNGGVNDFGDKVEPWMKRLNLEEKDPELLVRELVSTA